MLKETALTIWMIGLMTHVGDDTVGDRYTKNAVAIVADRHHIHQAGMIIFDVSNPSYLLTYVFRHGDRVEFKGGLSAGSAEATDAFVRYTPTLMEPLTNSLLDEPIKEARAHDDVLAWIHYPLGTLTIAGLKTDEANFFRGDALVRSQCVPASTRFDAVTHADITITVTHSNGTREPDIVIGPDAFILVVNEPVPNMTTRRVSPSLHFTNYSALLERRYGVIRRSIARVEVGRPCTESGSLSRGTTLGKLLSDFLATRLGGTHPSLQGLQRAATTHASHSPFALSNLVGILVSEDPACTNTDWP